MILKNIAILVVDDEPELREIISEEFTDEGALVTLAENGAKAFELLKKNKYEVVFSDLRMPGGGGLELLKNIKTRLHYQPIIFLCSGFSEMTEQESLQLGLVEVISKPFNLKKITKIIAGSLRAA